MRRGRWKQAMWTSSATDRGAATSSIICRSVPPGSKLVITKAIGSGAISGTAPSEQGRCQRISEKTDARSLSVQSPPEGTRCESGSGFALLIRVRREASGNADSRRTGPESGRPSTYCCSHFSNTTSCQSRSVWSRLRGEVLVHESADERRLEVAALQARARQQRVREQLAKVAAEPDAERHAEPLLAAVQDLARQQCRRRPPSGRACAGRCESSSMPAASMRSRSPRCRAAARATRSNAPCSCDRLW